MTALERADPSFAPVRQRSAARAIRERFSRDCRGSTTCGPAVLGRPFIRARGEAAVGDGELRGAIEERNVAIQCGPQRARSDWRRSHTA